MSSTQLPDALTRLAAATDFARNLVIVAGAGTGKTSLLIERLLTAIGAGRVKLEEVAAVTFTEKAAGEMRQRFAAGLDRLGALARNELEFDAGRAADRALQHLTEQFELDPATVAARALAALQRFDRARISTIHGFCANLLREFPLEAGVDPGFAVDAGEIYQSLREQSWDGFLSRELGPDGERAELWSRVLEQFSLADLQHVAFRLAEFGVDRRLFEQAAPGGDVVSLLGEPVRRIVDDINTALDGSPDQKLVGAVRLRKAQQALTALLEQGLAAFQQACLSSPDLLDKVRGGDSTIKRFGPVAQRTANEFREIAQYAVQVDEQAIACLLEAVTPFAREVREELLRQGFIDFDGLLALTRDLVRDHPEVRRRLKRRFKMLLLDEFQDTDPLQYEIMFYLAESERGAASEAYQAVLEPGRLFIVGDPKQSIYRFRGADYSAFRRAVRHVTDHGGKQLDLTANFRSVPELVEPVNLLFADGSSVAWRESPHQPPYVPITAVRNRREAGPGVELWTVEIGQGTLARDRREAEGKVVARAIQQLVEQEGRTGYGQISILLRTFTHLSDYLRPLRELEIPFVVDGGREFFKRPEVTQLIVILKAIARPADPVALLAFLRSPLGAVPDTELSGYAAAGGRWRFDHPVERERCPNIARAFQRLAELSQLARDASPGEVVRLVQERTGLLVLNGAAFEGPQRVANLRKLAAAATELAWDGRLSLIEIVEALEQGRTSAAQADSPLADEQANAVQIMTIHKSKGLENDIVIIPDLAREDWRGPQDRVETLRLDGHVRLAIRTASAVNLARVRYELEELWHHDAEETRVLYVGTTRARERLILLSAPERRKASWIRALGAWGYDAHADPPSGIQLAAGTVSHENRLERDWRSSTPRQRRPEGLPQAVQRYRDGLERLVEVARPLLGAPSTEERWEEPRTKEPPSRWLAIGRERAKTVGVIVHGLLERWDRQDPEHLRQRISAAVTDAGADDEAEREVREIVERFLGSELAKRLVKIDVVGRELPMLARRDDRTGAWAGTIDLLYRDGDGRYVVADYKTDRSGDDAALALRYGPQLRIYADAVGRALDVPTPRRELWLLRAGKILDLGDEPEPSPGKWAQTRLF